MRDYDIRMSPSTPQCDTPDSLAYPDEYLNPKRTRITTSFIIQPPAMSRSQTNKGASKQREAKRYDTIYQQVSEQFGRADIDPEIQAMRKAELDGLKEEFGQNFYAPGALPENWTDKDIEEAIGGLKEFKKRIPKLAIEASDAYVVGRWA